MKLTEIIDYPNRTWRYRGSNKILVVCDWLTETWDRFNLTLLSLIYILWLPQLEEGFQMVVISPAVAIVTLLFLKAAVAVSRFFPFFGGFFRVGRAIHFSLFSRLIVEKAPRMMVSS